MTDTRHSKAEPENLSAGDTARALGVAVETVRRWEREGKITSFRTAGGHRRFPRTEIDRLLAPVRSAS